MTTTAIDYIRSLVTSHNLNDTINNVSVSMLADALKEIDAKEKAVPSTGEMLHLAGRICEGIFNPFDKTGRENRQIVNDILTDAPEVIALQQGIDGWRTTAQNHYENLERLQAENRELKEALLHRESVIESLAAPSKGEKPGIVDCDGECTHGIPLRTLCGICALEQPRAMAKENGDIEWTTLVIYEPCHACHGGKLANAGLYRFLCQRCGGTGKEMSAKREQELKRAVGIIVHTGRQSAYDSCPHGYDNDSSLGALVCPICEPRTYAQRCNNVADAAMNIE